MIEEPRLRELVAYEGQGKVLSVYVDTDLAHRPKEAVILELKDRVRPFANVASDEIEVVSHFLDFEYDWQSRSVGIFASGRDYQTAVPLPDTTVTQAYYIHRPVVRPLVDVLDRLGQYAVAVIDRQSVRLFSVTWGRIEAASESIGEEIKHHRQGGWAAARYQRHEDNLALHNLKQAVEVIDLFCQEAGCGRLVLGGNADVLTQVNELVPRPLRDHIVGEFSVEMQASPAEILDLATTVMTRADRAEEQRLVSDAITAAAKGGAAVMGLADTMAMLHQGRVHMLLVDDGYRPSGWVCPQCGYVSTDQGGACPLCMHDAMNEAPDVVDAAVYKALQSGTQINVVRQNADMAAAGGIGAILRY
jgi:peptide chain release factor subunit 1